MLVNSSSDEYNEDGFNGLGIHKDTGTEQGPCGAKEDGYNDAGFNTNGLDRNDKNVDGKYPASDKDD